MSKLSKKLLNKFQKDGLIPLLYAGIRYVYINTIRPNLSCQRYYEIRGITVYSSTICEKRLDGVFGIDRSWPQNHKKPNCDFIRKYADKGDTVVIIGGGYGISSVVAATTVGQTGTVSIYEAAEKLIDELLNTLSVNEVAKQTNVYHAAVGNVVDLKSSTGEAEKVQPVDLPSCDVIEMDCEGSEIDIIPKLSTSINTIIVETHPSKGVPTTTVEGALEDQGWEIVESASDRKSGDVLVAK